jgi:hypothetical protein
MIERYTIKFGPAVSQNELEGLHGPDFNDFVECDGCGKKPGSPVLGEDCLRRRAEFEETIGKPQPVPDLHMMKAQIEVVCDFEDLRTQALRYEI